MQDLTPNCLLDRNAARTAAGWARRGVVVLSVVACVIVFSVRFSCFEI